MSLVFACDTFGQHPYLTCGLVFLFGLLIGSFLNVLALRSLAQESIIYPGSHCPCCKHKLTFIDNIPLLSYFLLKGHCRYCKAIISWQYPLVEFTTGITFAVLAFSFLVLSTPHLPAFSVGNEFNSSQEIFNWQIVFPYLSIPIIHKISIFIGLACFTSTLIAVTTTDIKEKLIPHEITYPSMIIGLFFSISIRHDLLGALAGMGISYIIFDFLAFYGLKLYLKIHDIPKVPVAPSTLTLMRTPSRFEPILEETDEELDKALILTHDQEEPLEVMGGGDAVLGAVIAAYLGWQLLLVTLIIAFLSGTLIGLFLLLIEISRYNLLNKAIKSSVIYAGFGGLIFAMITYCFQNCFLSSFTRDESFYFTLQGTLLGITCGTLLGIIAVGTKVSKPFPFGPALALGGFIVIFLTPYRLPFY